MHNPVEIRQISVEKLEMIKQQLIKNIRAEMLELLEFIKEEENKKY